MSHEKLDSKKLHILAIRPKGTLRWKVHYLMVMSNWGGGGGGRFQDLIGERQVPVTDEEPELN